MHIYTDPICLEHEVPTGHPERPQRLQVLLDFLERSGFTATHPLLTPQPASAEALLRAHPQAHLDFITALSDADMQPVDPDTWTSRNGQQAALVAAGAVCDGVEALLSEHTRRVFCAVRPPGHHAERSGAMGFCLYNSVAVGALQALQAPHIERVAIVDFDVHHGNGTVDIFRDNPAVLVCSSFQHPHYPNRLFDVARNHIVSTPLAAGTGSDVFRQRIESEWLPALEQHQPQLILVSAGFDAHQADPLGDLNLQEADYAWITDLIVDIAERHAGGRVLSTLEGGYHLEALVGSVEAHLTHLA